MVKMGENGVIAVVGASAGRRVMGCAVLYLLGALLIYICFVEPPTLFWLIFVLGLATGVLVIAERLRRATTVQLVLTADALSDTNGQVLTPLTEIQSIDRGAFAFKPSNGFTLKLKSKQPRSWAPGLWWRYGRFLGVGGAVSAGQAKFMAEQIALTLAQRAADDAPQ